jgi:hypothetical protein
MLAQHTDDLFFREPASLHSSVSLSGRGLYLYLEEFSGLRSIVQAATVLEMWEGRQSLGFTDPPGLRDVPPRLNDLRVRAQRAQRMISRSSAGNTV